MDSRTREAERAWRETGTEDAFVNFVRARRRAGLVEQWKLDGCAVAGVDKVLGLVDLETVDFDQRMEEVLGFYIRRGTPAEALAVVYCAIDTLLFELGKVSAFPWHDRPLEDLVIEVRRWILSGYEDPVKIKAAFMGRNSVFRHIQREVYYCTKFVKAGELKHLPKDRQEGFFGIGRWIDRFSLVTLGDDFIRAVRVERAIRQEVRDLTVALLLGTTQPLRWVVDRQTARSQDVLDKMLGMKNE